MTSAEGRAKEAIRDLLSLVAVNGSAVGLAHDLADTVITTALLEAQDAKLEEALAKIGQGHWGTKENPHRHGSSGAVWIGMKPDEMIATIRSLISKKD